MAKWRDYEEQIFAHLCGLFPEDTKILRKQYLKGHHSQRKRQIDILVYTKIGGVERRIVVDCKCFSSNITLSHADAFSGFIDDVGVDFGLMITTKGFSKAAARRAGKGKILIEVIDFANDIQRMPYFSKSCCEICNVNRTDCPLTPIEWGPHLAFIDKDGQPRIMMVGLCSSCFRLYVDCGRCRVVTEVLQKKIGKQIKCASCGIEFKLVKDEDFFKIELGSKVGA